MTEQAAPAESQEKLGGILPPAVYATITTTKADGTTTSEESPRNIWFLANFLAARLRDNPDQKDDKIGVFVVVDVPPTAEGGAPEQRRVDLIKDMTLAAAVDELAKRGLSMQHTYAIIMDTINRVSEAGPVKAVIFTAVLGDGIPVGFGFISDALPVTDGDVMILGEAAAGQVEQFKDSLRKKGIQFPSDNPIVAPTMREKNVILGNQAALKPAVGGLITKSR